MENDINGEYDFKKDLVKGELGENEIIEYMQNLGFQFINRRNDNKYDFSMGYNGKIYTYEIKTDIFPRDTGNIAIEVESRGKPSGVSVTHADYFVTYFKHLGEIWNIKTKNLLELIDNEGDDFRFIENAGDPGSNTKLYLIKKKDYKSHFRVHTIGKV